MSTILIFLYNSIYLYIIVKILSYIMFYIYIKYKYTQTNILTTPQEKCALVKRILHLTFIDYF